VLIRHYGNYIHQRPYKHYRYYIHLKTIFKVPNLKPFSQYHFQFVDCKILNFLILVIINTIRPKLVLLFEVYITHLFSQSTHDEYDDFF
jgi:hypothetical protein